MKVAEDETWSMAYGASPYTVEYTIRVSFLSLCNLVVRIESISPSKEGRGSGLVIFVS